jgi:hypothetical protein
MMLTGRLRARTTSQAREAASPDFYWKDSGEYPPWRKQLKEIADPVAEERFTYRTPDGKKVTSRIVIGHPRPVPKDFGDEWYCPVIIEGRYIGIKPILGMGPVTALTNAGTAVRMFLEEVVFASERTSKKVNPGRRTARGSRQKKATGESPAKQPPRKTKSRKHPRATRS